MTDTGTIMKILSCLKISADAFIDAVFPPRASEVLVRNASYDSFRELVRLRSVTIEGLEIHTLLSYGNALVQAAILEAKFHKNAQALALLGGMLSRQICEIAQSHIKVGAPEERPPQMPLVLVPIPLGAKRRAERGYNQVEEIAKNALKLQESMDFMSTNGETPLIRLVPEILTRTRPTEPQMTLGRQARLLNMKNAFTVPMAYQTLNPACIYVLLDDVVTTGSTLLSAHAALRKAGARRIFVLALAH